MTFFFSAINFTEPYDWGQLIWLVITVMEWCYLHIEISLQIYLVWPADEVSWPEPWMWIGDLLQPR